jgi:signal transduction histidine kinase
MKVRLQTIVSVGLVALLGALPIGHVWLSALGQARRDADAVRKAPLASATVAAERLAERVATRLSDLVGREAERPYFHWQHFIADPRGVYEGEALVPSPLAGGPPDPLVYAYVQVDERGRVTTPEIFEGAESPPTATVVKRHEEVVAALGPIEVAQVEMEVPAEEPQIQVADNQAKMPVQQRAIPSKNKMLGNRDNEQQVVVQELDNVFYQQNENVAAVFEQIQKKGPRRSPSSGAVAIRVGAFVWRPMEISSAPALLAMRTVDTPDGPREQGFVVRAAALAESLREGGFEGRLEVVGEPSESAESDGQKPDSNVEPSAPVRLGSEEVWRVAVPTDAATSVAMATALDIEADAELSAIITTLLSLLVAGLVIAVLIQSERLLERRQRFAAAAAHELRTPLAGLRMYAEMLAHGLGRPEKQQIYAERLVTEVARLGRVVSNVLDFSRLEKKSLSLSPRDGDVGVLLKELVARLAPTISAAGATLELELPGAGSEPLSARFDADALTQVLTNLVDNAEKYTRGSADRLITVTAQRTLGGVNIHVRDRGPGLQASKKKRLFLPFARGVDKHGPAGLGLGLALSRALARAQGGDLYPMTPAGQGAELVVTLPAAAA